jgi:hypothetical protein
LNITLDQGHYNKKDDQDSEWTNEVMNRRKICATVRLGKYFDLSFCWPVVGGIEVKAELSKSSDR